MMRVILIIVFVVLYFVFLDKHVLRITSSWYESQKRQERAIRREKDRQKVRELIASMGKRNVAATANELQTIIGIGEVAIEPLIEALAKSKSQFVCQECGAVHAKWSGKCEGCDGWNTLTEEAANESAPKGLGNVPGCYEITASRLARVH